MSKLSELIARLCPDGVEYLQVQEIVNIKPGRDYKHLQSGNIPVYGSGGIMTYVNEFSYNRPTVLLPRKGSISNIFYVDKPFWNVDTIYYTEINEAKIVPRYFYHVMCHERIEKLNTSNAARPALTREVLNKIKIPVPPLEVQREIVRILDNFAELTTELTEKLNAELIARKKQYEYYRDLLLTFDNAECPRGGNNDRRVAVRWMKLIDVCDYVDYRGKTPKKTEQGIFLVTAKNIRFGYIDYDSSKEYIDKENYEEVMRRGKPEIGDVLLTTEAPCGYVAQVDRSDIALAQRVIKYRGKSNLIDNSFLKYVLMSSQWQDKLQKNATGSTVKGIKGSKLHQLTVPVPPLSEQRRIVAILDRFDALCHDISAGLPVEIAARKKQYEYYRDKLLTFEEKTA